MQPHPMCEKCGLHACTVCVSPSICSETFRFSVLGLELSGDPFWCVSLTSSEQDKVDVTKSGWDIFCPASLPVPLQD